MQLNFMTNQSTTYTDAARTWDSRYNTDDYIFGTEPNRWLHQHAGVLPAQGRALCLADGEGRNSVWLAGRGLEVDAFDVSAVGVNKAHRLAAKKNVLVNYMLADCDSFAWTEQTYDVVVAIFVQFADPAMRARLFRNMVAAIKPGGLVLLQGYTPKQLEYRTGGPPEVSHLYTAEMLRESFAELSITELTNYEEVMQEGSRHHGLSALIGMVARKNAI
jgi:2-polyprenyl-3-methyl-5-hydroxy-6-metoxy-1,4-benzoquinol methylase